MGSEDTAALGLSIRCPVCGINLQLMEDNTYVTLGCPRCRRYVRMTKRYVHRNFLEYGNSSIHLRWSELLRELYIRMSGAYQ
jgi:phage FluMu protein Com